MSSQKSSQYKADSKMELDSNGKAWIFQPSGLNFVWGGDSRYWVFPKEPWMPAGLKMVSWLELTGSFEKPEPGKTYKIGFKISFKPEATGWDGAPLAMSKIGKKGKTVWKKSNLLTIGKPVNIPDESDDRLKSRLTPQRITKKPSFSLVSLKCGREDGRPVY